MRVKVKKSYWSSTAYDIKQRNRVRSNFKRRCKKPHKEIGKNSPRSPYAKKQRYKISLPKTMVFPHNVKDCNNFLKKCQETQRDGSRRVSIDLRVLKRIDNTSILLLTANINNIFEKLYRNKKLAPRRDIDERLAVIGFWDALCANPPEYKKDIDFLRIKLLKGTKMTDNGFHKEIINFFTQEHNISVEHKEGLFDAVFEACANSFEHAYNESDTDKQIWFLGSYDNQQNELEFVFYDIGMGIFSSLESQRSQLGRLIKKYILRFGKGSALKKLCTTNLSKYKRKKGKSNRGNGMISFKDFIDKISTTRVANLEVTTEDFFYSSRDGKVTKISKPIKGTLIRWVVGGYK